MKALSKSVGSNPTESARVLVVSREPAGLASLQAIGQANAWEIEITGSGCEALERVQSGSQPNLVLLDLAQGDADGLFTLRWLRRVRPGVPVVLLAHSGDAQQRTEAMRLGAHDYLVRPVHEKELEGVMRSHLASGPEGVDTEITSETVEQIGDDAFFVASSPIMRKLRAQAELLAQVDVPLLIVGESGSGKESTARLIHKLSVRSGFRFRKVNCAALPGDLLERELFGYEPGAFPGAVGGRPGKFELSEKGTILLDDIEEMPSHLQAKLLQVLQDKQFSRIGAEARVTCGRADHCGHRRKPGASPGGKEAARRSVLSAERFHRACATSAAEKRGDSFAAWALDEPDGEALWAGHADVFAGRDRSLPGPCLAGQFARARELREALLGDGREPGTGAP